MITKTALSFGLGALVGALRSGKLTDAEKKILTKAYGLNKDSFLAGRNAVRGGLGAFLGNTGGAIAGAVPAMALGATSAGVASAAALAAIPAAIYGICKGSSKYSKKGVEKARKILEDRAKKAIKLQSKED